MDITGPAEGQPARDVVESDPAYDFAEDAPVEDTESVDEELLEEAEQSVPLEAQDFLGEEQPVVPADADEFRDREGR